MCRYRRPVDARHSLCSPRVLTEHTTVDWWLPISVGVVCDSGLLRCSLIQHNLHFFYNSDINLHGFNLHHGRRVPCNTVVQIPHKLLDLHRVNRVRRPHCFEISGTCSHVGGNKASTAPVYGGFAPDSAMPSHRDPSHTIFRRACRGCVKQPLYGTDWRRLRPVSATSVRLLRPRHVPTMLEGAVWRTLWICNHDARHR